MTHPKNHYKNKVVCVTGAGGSIGSEICRKLVEYEVSQIIMVGHSELPLYEIGRELEAKATAGAIVKVLSSVRDEPYMRDIFERFAPNIVIHAAAHKHVPLCEQNPLEAIENNVGGTMALARAAASLGVEQFVLVSSDKAVRPSSVMGATKRACELYLEFFSARTSMRCTTVRFGNVLNSSGSVLPLWREQLRKGEKITLTDKRCTRFFMTIPEAVELTLGAASLPRTGLFVLDMGTPKSIYELAKQTVAEVLYPGADCYTPDDHIVETGLHSGEKLEEELSYGGESVKTSLPRVLRVRENPTGRLTRWSDFSDLLMAAQCRAKDMALDQLWSMVR